MNLIKTSHLLNQTTFLRRELKKDINTSNYFFKVVGNNGKGESTYECITRHLNDICAKESRYRSAYRIAYKLLEIDDKYHIRKPGYSTVNCAAAPVSWTQVDIQKLKLNDKPKDTETKQGTVGAVDDQHMPPIKSASISSESDFTDSFLQKRISELLMGNKANVILKDMDPKVNDTKINNLKKPFVRPSEFAVLSCQDNGIFLVRLSDSSQVDLLYKNLRVLFKHVTHFKLDSSKIYMMARSFRGMKQKSA